MNNTPTVTVLMAAYNVEPYLEEAVKSVLNQNFTDFELLIVEDGSTDNTKEVLNKFNDPRIIKLYNEKNMGLIYSLNRGIAAARGKYIARFDSDDIMLQGRLKKQVKYLENHPETGLITAQTIVMYNYIRTGIFYNPVITNAIEVGMLTRCTISHNCVTFRNDLLKKLSLKYSTEYGYMEDYGLWANLIGHTKMKATHNRFAVYRKYGNSTTDRVYSDNKNNSNIFQTRKEIISLVMDRLNIKMPENMLENYVLAIGSDKNCNAKMLSDAFKSILHQIPKGMGIAKIPLVCYFCEIWYKTTKCKNKGSGLFSLNLGGNIYKYYKKAEYVFYKYMKLKVKKVI